MADMSSFTQYLPSVSMEGASSFILVLVGAVLFCGALCVVAYLVILHLRYNKKIKVFKKVGLQIIPVAEDKGWEERLEMAGDTWLRVRKSKKILPTPSIQMGKNEYWYYVREDGEWINFRLGNFDEQMRELGAYFVDMDMRLQRLGIRKNIQDRFNKVTFWQKYGGMIMSVVYILVVTICLVILFRQMSGAWGGATQMAEAVKEMAQEVANMRLQFGSGMATP